MEPQSLASHLSDDLFSWGKLDDGRRVRQRVELLQGEACKETSTKSSNKAQVLVARRASNEPSKCGAVHGPQLCRQGGAIRGGGKMGGCE